MQENIRKEKNEEVYQLHYDTELQFMQNLQKALK